MIKKIIQTILILCFVMGISNAVLTDDLLIGFKFDENTGSSFTDVLGIQNGVNYGSQVWSTGIIGSSMYLDGSLTDYIVIPNNPLTDNTYSINLWMYPIMLGASEPDYGLTFGLAETGKAGILFVRNKSIAYGIFGGSPTYRTANDFLINQWSMITVTSDGTTTRIYHNGNYIGNGQSAGSLTTYGVGEFVIGARIVTYIENYKGKVDEFYLWDRVITDAEITQLYNSGTGLSYPFGEDIEEPHLPEDYRSVEFNLINKESLSSINNTDIYLLTPCLKENEINKYYNTNKSIYWKQVVEGSATMDLLINETYNICLMTGRVSYYDNNESKNFKVIEGKKIIEIGEFAIKNTTSSYNIYVDNTDIYPVLSTSFWSVTWSALFKLIISLIIGGFIIVIGLFANSGKVIVVGGLIIAIGMGLTLSTFAILI